MPYESEAQRRFFHTRSARRKGITHEMAEEFDREEKKKHHKPKRKSAKKRLAQQIAEKGY